MWVSSCAVAKTEAVKDVKYEPSWEPLSQWDVPQWFEDAVLVYTAIGAFIRILDFGLMMVPNRLTAAYGMVGLCTSPTTPSKTTLAFMTSTEKHSESLASLVTTI